MTVFDFSRMGRAGVLAGTLLLLCAAAAALSVATRAAAQSGDGAPIRLTPPSLDGGDGSAGGGQGRDPAPATGQPAINSATPRQGIQIQPLAQPSIETVGVLDPAEGGYGYDLWEGSQRGIVLGLTRRIPGRLDSFEARQIARRLLLTDAAPPEGGSEHRNAELLIARVERLRALGDTGGLLRLVAVVPDELVTRELARYKVEAQLLEGDYQGACDDTRPDADFTAAPGFWQKTLIFCQIHGGETAAAQLGLQLMAELPPPDSEAFLAMGQRMLDGLGSVPASIGADAPALALADLMGESLPEGFLPLETPGFARAALRLAGLPAEERALAAEIAAQRRLAGAAEVTRAYREIPFTGEQLDAALTLAASQPSAVGRALLFQAGGRESDAGARAEILLNAFESAENDGRFRAVVEAFGDQLQRLETRPDLAWFAATAGRGLYVLGRFERAAAWLELARREAVTSPQAQASVTLLWPYALLAGDSAADWDGSLTAWSLARNETEGEVARMEALLYAVFSALDVSARLEPQAARAQGFAGPVTPDLTNLPALRDASLAGRRGETVLLALLVLGEDGSRAVEPRMVEASLEALRRVGMTREARALAIEMVLRAGI